ncbi:hypothetical protein C1A50_2350 [Paenibacillus polymyxa]|uniref:Uncharacterized protein n=1 Tax=Paenibacillus polymyxa TaxID=1406 RepID=A0A378XYM2_PAEPO|nr:hypothetical protein C1A50_2350 [Paenibacillus polymyxa]SEK06183.1 hypothetical protein SAMN04488600_110103 [Paenibacillus polymyxa]SUA69573.1 Uncharacterised protein [Paenibacillus polymyxa]
MITKPQAKYSEKNSTKKDTTQALLARMASVIACETLLTQFYVKQIASSY